MTTSRPRGVIAAIATPVDAKGEPDLERFARLARYLLDNGCDGLNVLGTTGEATSFSLAQRIRVMEHAKAAGLPMGRLMVGTGAAAVADAVELTRKAAEFGFGGALVLPPFYYKNVPASGIMRYFDRLVTETADSGIPLYLYNFPAQSGIKYEIALIRDLIATHGERIAGLKDSSGDMAYAREAAGLAPHFDVFPSNEASLGEARDGTFAGCISATANVNSAYCARALHGKDDAALETATRIRRLFDGKPLVPGVKALVAHIMGDRDYARTLPPFVDLDAGLEEEIRAGFEALTA